MEDRETALKHIGETEYYPLSMEMRSEYHFWVMIMLTSFLPDIMPALEFFPVSGTD